jgi:hypothetical protein
MPGQLQLQRDSEIFYSTQNFSGGDTAASFTPANTWKIEILAGYATSQASGTQDITATESGLNPDRSTRRFNINIQPVDWNFQAYLRPTGVSSNSNTATSSVDGNVKPIADWMLWQALLSNTAPAIAGTSQEQSAWLNNGTFQTITRVSSPNVAAHTSNFGVAQQNHLYVKMDNVLYQIANAAIESADVNGDIAGIAMTTWTGKGTNLLELTGVTRDQAISVFGGTTTTGTLLTANSNAYALSAGASYHPWASYNVQGAITSASFIKNRLGAVTINYQTAAGVTSAYTFPVTAMQISVKNNLTYLTPEEMSKLNQPIGQFAGAREVTGTLSAYLRADANGTSQFLRTVLADTRPTFAQFANANIKIGGSSNPYVAFFFPATQFNIPVTNVSDLITVNMAFKAQETTANEGLGDELTITAQK